MPHGDGPTSALARRTFLRGVAAGSAGLLAGCSDGAASGERPESDERPRTDAQDGRVERLELSVVDAPGDAGGTIAVPVPGAVTLVDLFATWCGPCVEQLGRLRSVHRAVGDDVRFVSVTNQAFGGTFTRRDLREWWDEHGGPWTVAHDARGQLFFRLNAGGLPHTAVVDRTGRVRWTHRGVTRPETVIDRIEAAGAHG